MEKINVIDMYLAATFLAYGAELLEIDRSDLSRQKFCFGGKVEQIFVFAGGNTVLRIEDPSLDVVKTKFIGRVIMFPPSFTDSLRRIKAAIHDI